MVMEGRYGNRTRDLRTLILSYKQGTERTNSKWHKSLNAQSLPPSDTLPARPQLLNLPSSAVNCRSDIQMPETIGDKET